MDKKYMEEAIRLAYFGMENNKGGPFGAVIVRGDEIIGKGYNTVTSTNDPTAHAEINAIRDACKNIENCFLEGCVIYTSSEPCPMCLAAIYWARIDSIYYGCTRRDAAQIGFIDEHIYEDFKLPKDRREITTMEFMRQEAIGVFHEWKKKEDKINY